MPQRRIFGQEKNRRCSPIRNSWNTINLDQFNLVRNPLIGGSRKLGLDGEHSALFQLNRARMPYGCEFCTVTIFGDSIGFVKPTKAL